MGKSSLPADARSAGMHHFDLLALIESLEQSTVANQELSSQLARVAELLAPVSDPAAPFLTVLLRTQGRRIEPFKDALLCLAAQSHRDFEVVILGHDVESDALVEIAGIIEEYTPLFSHAPRLIRVSGGTRSRPLNVGIDAAKGNYVAVYDDDDLLFAHWVEAFYESAISGDSRILRAVVANQVNRPEPWSDQRDGFRAISWPKVEHPTSFHQLDHLVVNYSPFMSWAFPRSLFSTMGLRFDEELTVCEDWDIILRGSLLYGVDDVAALTSIYRRWEGAASSYSEHTTDSWRASERRVIDRLNQQVVMLPPGSVEEIRQLVLLADGVRSFRFLFNGNDLRWPLNVMWRGASPAVRLLVRARNVLRRRLSR
jgi:glycosyltransferase involved in cell wall biosynthesis